jgi:putative endonuclease
MPGWRISIFCGLALLLYLVSTSSAGRMRTSPERCPSGLRSTLGKRVLGKLNRGFESHPLRHPTSRGFGWHAHPVPRRALPPPKAPDGRSLVIQIVWYVYTLRSATDDKLYVGSTNDLSRRLREHNEGECNSTRHRRPLELEAYIAVREESTARSLESQTPPAKRVA